MTTPPRPNRDITAEEIAAYERDGAVVLRGVIQAEWLQRMQEAVERVLTAPSEAAEEYAKDGGRYLGDMFMWLRDEDFRALALASPLPTIARQVMGSDAVGFFYDQLLVKEAMTPTETPWHQDLPYWPLRGSQIVSLWVGCDPVAADAGAMRYIKGSHKAGVMYAPRAFDATSGFGEIYAKAGLPPFPDVDTMMRDAEILVCEVEPGDVIVHHPLTFHGSPGNMRVDRRRRALALRYVGDDACFDARPGTFMEDPKLADILPEPIAYQDGARLGGANFPRIF